MNQTNAQCVLCERVALLLQEDRSSFLIHEFQHSVFIVGEHQFFRGYSMLVFKKHVRELHELEPTVQSEMFAELMIAGRAVADAFQPWKMNYSCYGNVVPHIHWHLFPRYASDPDREQIPWFHADKFEKYKIDESAAQYVAAEIRSKSVLSQS